MSKKDASLYGVKRKGNALNLNNDFGAQMSAAIASSQSNPKKRASNAPKDDLFTANRPSAKKPKAAKKQKGDSGADKKLKLKDVTQSSELAEDDWTRSQRQMAEKSRLYSALQRGDIEDDQNKYGVDFDKKWADRHPEQGFSEQEDTPDEDADEPQELVQYTDSLGRTRTGTKRDARLADLEQSGEIDAGKAGYRARAPDGLIYGDAIQTEAFDPDAPIASKMAALAAQRDKSPTPPPPVHYDADSEVRTRGTAFFKFSKDEATRQRQMAELEAQRQETDARRGVLQEEEERAREKRKRELEERRKVIAAKKARREADEFMESFVPGQPQDVETKMVSLSRAVSRVALRQGQSWPSALDYW